MTINTFRDGMRGQLCFANVDTRFAARLSSCFDDLCSPRKPLSGLGFSNFCWRIVLVINGTGENETWRLNCGEARPRVGSHREFLTIVSYASWKVYTWQGQLLSRSSAADQCNKYRCTCFDDDQDFWEQVFRDRIP